MSLATGITKRLDSVLTRFNLTDRPVYKRVITRTGGDPLLGKPASVSVVDTLFAPQPAVQAIFNKSIDVVVGTSIAQVGDYLCTFSPTALSRADLANKDMTVVFKDASGTQDELFVEAFGPTVLNGVDVVFDVLIRSKKRS